MGAFLAAVGKWLISNPWRTAALALLITVGVYHFIRVPALESTIDNQKTKIAELDVSIRIQNKAVEEMKRRTEAAEANQKKALAEAAKNMAKTKVVTKTILGRPVPTKDKECDATLELLKEFQQ